MIHRSLILFLLVLALATITSTSAQTTDTCAATIAASQSPASEGHCYTHRASCQWSPSQGKCIDDPPATCLEYRRDSIGCNANALCGVNALSGYCYTKPPACSTLAQTICSGRSDCTWDAGSCTATPSGCGEHTTGTTCGANGCYWDSDAPDGDGQCYRNLQEVNSLYGCSMWSYYPSGTTAFACAKHGCASLNSVCSAVDAGSVTIDGGGYETETTIQYTTVNPYVIPNTFVFTSDIAFSLTQGVGAFWKPTAPTFYVIALGRVTTDNYASYLTNQHCSSFLSQVALGSAIPASNYIDQPGLLNHFISTVQVNRTTATSDPMYASEINKIIGQWNIGANKIIKSVDFNNDITNIQFKTQVDLNWCVNHCGCTMSTTTGITPSTVYTVPWSIISRTDGDNIAATTQDFAITINSYGSIQISANSNNAMTVRLRPVVDVQCTTPGNELKKKRTFSTVYEFVNAFDPSQIVGLTGLGDISIDNGANCFGTYAVSVQVPTSCTDNICQTIVQWETNCQTIDNSGDSLNICPGGSSTLDRKHTHRIKPKSWNVGAPDLSSAVPVGQDPTGMQGDEVVITIDQTVYPLRLQSANIKVSAGLAPSPTSTFASVLSGPALYDGNANTSTIDVRNIQLRSDGVFTPVIYLSNADIRTSYALKIVPSSITFYPLNSAGQQFAGSLEHNQFKNALARSPRLEVETCSYCLKPSSVGEILPGPIEVIGNDGFSIPVRWLRELMPANGYRVTMNWYVEAPAQAINTSGPGGRRLLQVADNSTSTITEQIQGTISYGFVVITTNSTTGERIGIEPLAFVESSAKEDLRDAVLYTSAAVGGTAVVAGSALVFLVKFTKFFSLIA